MSTILTAAGESLIARLQAEGTPLVIDTMILANVPGQDHTQAIAPGVTVPAEDQIALRYAIPPQYRAYVNPNQVVYSAMLGSDMGDFTFNWQGLWCSAHETLVAVATFPALEKRQYDEANGKTGNNLTRNFLLTFTGARELTGLTISADVWQLDFTVRLGGMDERERLSNFDIYGQAFFDGQGWLLQQTAEAYAFAPGLGYVGGIRAALAESLPLAAPESANLPQNVWLDVCLRHTGSDRVAEASPMLTAPDAPLADNADDETGLAHYRALVARIEADGSVTDLRPRKTSGALPIPDVATGDVAGTMRPDGETCYMRDDLLKVFLATADRAGLVLPDGVTIVVGDNGAISAGFQLCEFYYFRHPTLKRGMQPAQGGIIADAATKWPQAWAYLQTAEGQLLLKTEAQWQALSTAIWHTNADGTTVGWNGIGGVPWYVQNLDAGTLRIPDLRGMYAEAAGYDNFGTGGVHGDYARRIQGNIYTGGAESAGYAEGALYPYLFNRQTSGTGASGSTYGKIGLDSSRVVPVGNANKPRAWGALACCYLGTPAS